MPEVSLFSDFLVWFQKEKMYEIVLLCGLNVDDHQQILMYIQVYVHKDVGKRASAVPAAGLKS